MNQSKYKFLALAALACLSAQASAEADSLATILDYQPSCIVESLPSISIDSIVEKYEETGVLEESQAFKAALNALQVQAKEQGADAITLTAVKNHIVHSTSQRTTNYIIFKSTHKKTTQNRLITHLEADLFKLCPHDKSLSSQRTAFNAQGYAIQTISSSYTMTLPENNSPRNLAKKVTVPLPDISLNQGAFGIKLGMFAQQISDQLGPPSIEISLADNHSVWGYGRSHWFTFSNKQLIEINSDNPLLTSYGRNLIEFRDGFDDISWKINGTIPHKTTLEQVRKQLPKARQLITSKVTGKNHFTLSSQDALLRLSFEDFHPINIEGAVSLLTRYQLTPHPQQEQGPSLRPSALPTTAQLNTLMSLLNLQQKNQPDLAQLQRVYPEMSRLNISGTGVWWLVGSHIQVQFDNEKLSKLRLSPAVFEEAKTGNRYPSLIKSLGLSIKKNALFTQYPDASDNFDMVDLYRDDFALIAKYESEEDDAQMYELEIEYF